METKIQIDNIKCGGCAGTIRKSLIAFPGMEQVSVDPEKELVTMQHNASLDISAVKEKLHQLGYPEKGTTEGFDKFSSNIKSYVSCAIGKFSEDEKTEN